MKRQYTLLRAKTHQITDWQRCRYVRDQTDMAGVLCVSNHCCTCQTSCALHAYCIRHSDTHADKCATANTTCSQHNYTTLISIVFRRSAVDAPASPLLIFKACLPALRQRSSFDLGPFKQTKTPKEGAGCTRRASAYRYSSLYWAESTLVPFVQHKKVLLPQTRLKCTVEYTSIEAICEINVCTTHVLCGGFYRPYIVTLTFWWEFQGGLPRGGHYSGPYHPLLFVMHLWYVGWCLVGSFLGLPVCNTHTCTCTCMHTAHVCVHMITQENISLANGGKGGHMSPLKARSKRHHPHRSSAQTTWSCMPIMHENIHCRYGYHLACSWSSSVLTRVQLIT